MFVCQNCVAFALWSKRAGTRAPAGATSWMRLTGKSQCPRSGLAACFYIIITDDCVARYMQTRVPLLSFYQPAVHAESLYR